jgi:hypothetical protein
VQLIIPAYCWSVMINSILGLVSFGGFPIPFTADPQNIPASVVEAVLMNLRLFIFLLSILDESLSDELNPIGPPIKLFNKHSTILLMLLILPN